MLVEEHARGQCLVRIGLHGRVTGRLRGLKVRLSTSARCEGDIIHKTIAIESGAHFEGSVQRQDDPLGKAKGEPARVAAMAACTGRHPPSLEWAAAPVVNVCTRVAVEMCASSGRLVVAGWEAIGRVTAVTEVSCSAGPPASGRHHDHEPARGRRSGRA